ncbi:MAG: ABC transporter permease [Saprospiraceae bacterium]|nr:ABC transporter permease [Saprospiraceae bacterium]
MNKLWLIVKREYLTRVTKKSFILTTLLAPIAIGLFLVIVGLLMTYRGNDARDIVIVDQGDMLESKIKDGRNIYFRFSNRTVSELVERRDDEPFDAILVIPPLTNLQRTKHTIYYFADEQLDIDAMVSLQNIVADKIRDYKIKEMQLDAGQLASLNIQITLDPEPLIPSDDEGSRDNPSPLTSVVAAALGGVMGFVMYMIVFINGMMVMRSVMEEKMNRIVEVMISSVRPFYLMMGKILGVGGVGLTQLLIWAILIPLVAGGANLLFGFDSQQMMLDEASAELATEDLEIIVTQVSSELRSLNWWLIVPCFVVFFIGGYIVYSSLFAGIGSAIGDDLAESQALTLPITIPVILALYIMFVAIRVPNSPLAVWASIFPFFSPIVMPARLAFGPPAWQILLSITLLILAAIFCVWISGRIYRTGILMYGKKGSFREIWKWMLAKQ